MSSEKPDWSHSHTLAMFVYLSGFLLHRSMSDFFFSLGGDPPMVEVTPGGLTQRVCVPGLGYFWYGV